MLLADTKLTYETTALTVRLSILALKRAIDEVTPFDFINALGQGRMLFLGEGNLSFAKSIANRLQHRATSIVATTFEETDSYDIETMTNAIELRSLGSRVRGGIDASRCDAMFPLGSIDLAVFQFPNVGSRKPLYRRNANHILIRRFLNSVRNVLSKKGQVAITVVNSSYYDGAFHMDEVAQKCGYQRPVAHPFFLDDYEGYVHRKTKDDGKPAISSKDSFVTYVFRQWSNCC